MNDWYTIYCLLNNPDKIGHIISLIKREYFMSDLTLKVYDYILELYTKNTKATTDLIKSKFPDDLEKLYLDCNIDASAYEECVENQRQVYVNSEVRKLGKAIVNFEKDINITKFSDIMSELTSKLSSNTNSDTIHYMPDVVSKTLEQANRAEIYYDPFQFGIKPLDEWFNGFAPGWLVYIAGRPSMGKSGVISELCSYNSRRGLVGTLHTLEMEPREVTLRMLASLSELETWKLKRFKNRNVAEQKRVIEAGKQLAEMPLIIDDNGMCDINSIKSTAQKAILKYGRLDYIAVDYLQMMSGDEGLSDNARVTKISRGLKLIGKQFNCPLIVGSQLSRGCESRDNKRPMLSDMRDSGSIEQDADVVIMCYRDEYYTLNPEHAYILEMLIRKFRFGPVGKVIVEYNKQQQKIKEMNYNSQLGKSAKQFLYL